MNNCPVCSCKLDNIANRTAYPGFVDKSENILGFSEIIFCKDCKVGIAFPDVSDDALRDYYEKGGYWPNVAPLKALKKAIVPYALAKARWENIESLLVQAEKFKDIAILDIGAGHGFIGMLANESKKIKLNRYTCVEPDVQMRQCVNSYWFGRPDEHRLDIKKALDEVNGAYDVVVLSHVIEHLKDPLSMLKSSLALMTQGGVLLLEVPNQDYLFKNDVFPHLLFYNQDSLQRLINRTQLLETVSISCYGTDMEKSPLNRNKSLIQKVIGKGLGVLHGLLPRNILASFCLCYFGINRKSSNGTWIRALCRKK